MHPATNIFISSSCYQVNFDKSVNVRKLPIVMTCDVEPFAVRRNILTSMTRLLYCSCTASYREVDHRVCTGEQDMLQYREYME